MQELCDELRCDRLDEIPLLGRQPHKI
jgi:hypothetical protein